MKSKIKIRILTVIVLTTIMSCNNPNLSNVHYNLDFKEISEIARRGKKPFFFVVFADSCTTTYSEYFSKLGDFRVDKNAVINIIKTPDPRFNWYKQWLCSDNPIITCVFSADGILLATISGNSKYSFKFLQEVLQGKLENNNFGYRSCFAKPDRDDQINFLDKVFKCKIDLENNIDIEHEINNTLEAFQYPFNVYLKYLSERLKNESDKNTKYYADRLLNFDNKIFHQNLYSDLFERVTREINPEYSIEDLPVLFLQGNEIVLNDCQPDQKKPFEISVSNIGKTDLVIKTIDLGCGCLTLLSEDIPIIKPNTSFSLKLHFVSDKEGEVMREIIILSNAKNKLDTIKITAFSKNKGG